MTTQRHSKRALTVVLGLTAALLPALPTAPAYAEEIYPRPANGVFAMEGHGWGHGHGMSQWGAYGAATLGHSANTILSTYYPHTGAGTIGNPLVHIRLSRDEGVDLHVRSASGLKVGDLARPTARMALPAGPQHWRAVGGATGLHLQYFSSAGAWRTYPLSGATTMAGPVFFYGPPVVRVVYPGGSSVDYRRWVEARRVGSRVGSVAVMSMDGYLDGVVPRESPASWPGAALRAQAVAARSYAAFGIRANGDICDTTACQVFGGTASYTASGSRTQLEQPSTNAAVAVTTGQVRTYGGAPIFAQFSSSNGGYSTAGSQPYLVAKPDPWDGVVPNSVHYWTTGLPASAIERRHPSIGRLARIRVLARDGHGEWGGRVLTARLEGSAGSVTVDGSDLYYACPYGSCSYAGMKSSWWHSRVAVPTAPQNLRVYSRDQKAILTWSAPASAGSSPVTGYTVTASNGRSVSLPPTARRYYFPLPSGVHYTVAVAARNAGGRGVAAAAGVTPTWVAADYHPVTPRRLMDTRRRAPIGPGATRSLRVTGLAGVPGYGVNAVALNLTAVRPTSTGYVTVYATGEFRPHTTNVTFRAGRTVAVGGPLRVGVRADGYVTVYNSAGATDVLVDVVGYFDADRSDPTGSRYVPVRPRRVLDTRVAGGPVDQATVRSVDLSAVAPAGARAAIVNLTAVRPTAATWLVAYRSDTARPDTSTLNVGVGETRANLAVVPLSVTGRIDVYNRFGSTHVLVDVTGFLIGGAGLHGRYAAMLPTRLLDTRASGGAINAGETRRVRVRGVPGVAPTAGAAVIAITGFAVTASTYLTGWSGSGSRPPVSTVNLPAGGYSTNVAVVFMAADGTIGVFNAHGRAPVTVDLIGFFTA